MKYVYLFSLSFLFACGNSKEVSKVPISDAIILDTVKADPKKSESNVEITISYYSPYCGGAAPTPEILEQQNMLQSNSSFLLVDLKTDSIKTVQTNEVGILYLNLKEGHYGIRKHFKNCSFEDFQKQNPEPTGSYYVADQSDNCYLNWWKSNLLEFAIEKEDSVHTFSAQIREACFTGINPCIMYNGPWPP